MNIGSICQRRIVGTDSASSLVEAAGLMRDHHVGALVVTTPTPEGLSVSGIVTDRDLVIEVLARGLDASRILIGELARERVVSVSQDDDLDDAIAAMHEGGVRRLLVTDGEEQLIGIVSFDDLMAACALSIDGLAKVIRSGIEPEAAEAALPLPPLPPLRIPAMGTAGWGRAMA